MMPDRWELWGTFSVSDHLRPTPFAADVLLFDRLAVPTVTDDDVDRWTQLGRQPDLQARVVEVLRDLPTGAMCEVPWDQQKREYFQDNDPDPPAVTTKDLTAALEFDVEVIQEERRESPDSDGQYLTRAFLRDHLNAENDRKLFRGVPPVDIEVVAAYGSRRQMEAEVDLLGGERVDETEVDLLGGERIDETEAHLLGAFTWPFLVPAGERSGLDTLKRCVELANTDLVADYRAAFHEWRGKVLRAEMTPDEAAAELQERIDHYAAKMREERRRVVVKRAFVFTALTAGLAAPIFGLIGLSTAGGVAGIVGGGAAFEPVFGGVFARRSQHGEPASDVGAQFWRLQRQLAGG